MEKWKSVPGYEGLYIVSNGGRVYGVKKRKMLTPAVMSKGYMMVTLWKENTQRSYLVHRLVASVFIKNPQSLPQVNHKDGNKFNNFASNLEWTTCQENIVHSVSIGTFKSSCRRAPNQSPKRIPQGLPPSPLGLLTSWWSACRPLFHIGRTALLRSHVHMQNIRLQYTLSFVESALNVLQFFSIIPDYCLTIWYFSLMYLGLSWPEVEKRPLIEQLL